MIPDRALVDQETFRQNGEAPCEATACCGWREQGVSPFLLPFGDRIQLCIRPVPRRAESTGRFGLAPAGLLVSSTTRQPRSFNVIVHTLHRSFLQHGPNHFCLLPSESRLHCGEGTFLRVELCQRSSCSLHAAVVVRNLSSRRLQPYGFSPGDRPASGAAP